MKTRIILFQTVLIVFILAGLVFIFRTQIFDLWNTWMEEPIPEPISYDQLVNRRNENKNINIDIDAIVKPVEIPAELNLDVPFTPQAPHANWDLPYQEACEEASAISVHYFFESKKFTPDIADKEILDLVAWQESNFGFYKDTTVDQTAQFIREYWGYQKVEVITNPTIDDIKENIANGRPVIVPAAGQELGNPYFTSPGPLYHMLVVRGYTTTQFITNDVGTRRGENYKYDYDVLMSAIHDWNDGDVANGQKVMIVVWPNE